MSQRSRIFFPHCCLHAIYRFSLEDGHERQQERREVDGAQVVIGFYKYIGKSYKLVKLLLYHSLLHTFQIPTARSDKFITKQIRRDIKLVTIVSSSSGEEKSVQLNFIEFIFSLFPPPYCNAEPFDFPSTSSDSESEKLSSAYLPPSENLIRDVLAPSNEYLPPSNQYLPPN